jgi:hypothetical protein
MKCPHCRANIGLFSKQMSQLGKSKTCPHCEKGIELGFFTGRFTLAFFAVSIPVVLMGASSPIAVGIAAGLGAMLAAGLKPTR